MMRAFAALSQGCPKFFGLAARAPCSRGLAPVNSPAPRGRHLPTRHELARIVDASSSAAVAGPAGQDTPLFHDGWPLWCLLAGCGAIAQVCEGHTRWGAALSAPLLSMMCAVALAAAGIIPIDCPAYDTVWRFLMPMAAACFLLETDMQRLSSDGGPVLASFAVGAAGMVLGALSGWWLLREPLGPQGAKLAACLCASYVGGSVNFAAVALALQVPASSVPGAMAADNLLMAVFLAALMAVPVNNAALAAVAASKTSSRNSAAASRGEAQAPLAGMAGGAGQGGAGGGELESAAVAKGAEAAEATSPPVTAKSLSLTLAAAAASCAVAQHLAQELNAKPLMLLILAAVAAAMAATAQWVRGAARKAGTEATAAPKGSIFAGASQVGTSLMMLFFAVIGASAGSLGCLASCGVLVPFLLVMVGVHWVVVVAVGRAALRLPVEALLLGSNANIGGPATAAAMAAAKGWRPLIQPAMLAGSLGYAAGTAAGLTVARLVGAA